jgi:hypothetical protein
VLSAKLMLSAGGDENVLSVVNAMGGLFKDDEADLTQPFTLDQVPLGQFLGPVGEAILLATLARVHSYPEPVSEAVRSVHQHYLLTSSLPEAAACMLLLESAR